jgi:hypothetical protein
MSKTLLVLAATTSITVSLLGAPPAEARCRGCAAGAGVAAGVVTGTIVGSVIANTFFYASIGTILAMRRLRRRLYASGEVDTSSFRFSNLDLEPGRLRASWLSNKRGACRTRRHASKDAAITPL